MLSRRQILTSTTAAAAVAATGLPAAAEASLAPTPVQLAAERYFAAYEAYDRAWDAADAIERQSPYYEAHEQYLRESRAILDTSGPDHEIRKEFIAHNKAHLELEEKHSAWQRGAGYPEAERHSGECFRARMDAFDALMETQAETLSDLALMALVVEIENGEDPYSYEGAMGVGAFVRNTRQMLPLPDGFTLPARFRA